MGPRMGEAMELDIANEAALLTLIERTGGVVLHLELLPVVRCRYVSPAVEAISGYPPQRHYDDPHFGRVLVHPDDRPIVDDVWASADRTTVVRWIHADGRTVLTEQRMVVLREIGGVVAELVAVIHDITAERAASAERDRMAAIVAASPDAIYAVTRDGYITSWNPGAERLYGYTAEEAVGHPVTLVVPRESLGEFAEQLRQVERGEPWRDHRTRRRARDGRLIDVAITAAGMYDDDGALAGMSVIVRDITERLALERGLRHLAEHDALTGLPNRHRFETELRREIDHGLRHLRPSTVVLVDVDHFTFVNDSLGHAAGDRVIRQTGTALEEAVRDEDLVARLGADEFAVLLRETDGEAARAAAERLLQAVRGGVRETAVTATAGVAVFDGLERVDPEELLIAADIALYRAKQDGRDRVSVFNGRRGETLAWIGTVRDAIARDRFALAAQPIVDLASGTEVAAEVLIRMRGRDGELVPPGAFLPTAERFGLMRQIDAWVVERAARIAAAGRPVSVNLSAASIGDPAFGEEVERCLAASGASPADVVFEITETAAIGCLSEAARFTERMRDIGAAVALDDFGTGFGSLIYLKYLQIAYVKIDAEFVRELGASETDRRIVAGIVGMAAGMGARTVAEGVERLESLALLRDLGVDLAQGYAIARPAIVG